MAKPTRQQIKAVRKVLYDPTRLKALAEDIQQINFSMNLDGPPLQQNDSRVAVGDGPDWAIPANGQVDNFVLDAAGRCDSIVRRLMTMRQALSRVNLPPRDKRALMTALSEQALVWSSRAALWRDPTAPDDVDHAVGVITAHQNNADNALRTVQAYLRPDSDFNL